MENLVPSHRVRPSVLLPLWKVAGFVLGQFFLARLYHYPALCHTSASRLYHYPALRHTSVSCKLQLSLYEGWLYIWSVMAMYCV